MAKKRLIARRKLTGYKVEYLPTSTTINAPRKNLYLDVKLLLGSGRTFEWSLRVQTGTLSIPGSKYKFSWPTANISFNVSEENMVTHQDVPPSWSSAFSHHLYVLYYYLHYNENLDVNKTHLFDIMIDCAVDFDVEPISKIVCRRKTKNGLNNN